MEPRGCIGRFDPASGARLPWVRDYDMRLLVICNEGYTSSLAAAALHDLGLRRATDVIGGYQAWAAAGLPTARAEECVAVLAWGATPAVVIPRELSRTCGNAWASS